MLRRKVDIFVAKKLANFTRGDSERFYIYVKLNERCSMNTVSNFIKYVGKTHQDKEGVYAYLDKNDFIRGCYLRNNGGWSSIMEYHHTICEQPVYVLENDWEDTIQSNKKFALKK